MYFKKQSFLVLGVSRSGLAAAEFLLERGAKVELYDDSENERVERAMQTLTAKGARRTAKEDLPTACERCDALVLSPGIPIDHPVPVSFKRKGKGILGESELAARHLRCPILAVTGTNGKTTVVSMLTEVLQKGGYEAKACGNIGTPMLSLAKAGEETLAVAEISSFQLETLQSLCPHVALLLNVTEDHLNRHYTMENYLFLKAKLLKNLTETEFAVLNYDDDNVRELATRTKAQVLYFSVRERVRGAYLENGELYFGKEKILSANDLPTEGIHNIQNALAVIAAAKIMGVKKEDIVDALTKFKGIAHRVEWVGEVNGVAFIDDSKGTNVDATLKAVDSMKRETVLLLGGKHKGYDYKKLFAVLPKTKVVHAILYGENRYALLRSAREYAFDSVTLCSGFDFAVRVAALKAKSGQTVLLSPASASFDEFANYEERGNRFVQIVKELESRREEKPKSETQPSADSAELSVNREEENDDE